MASKSMFTCRENHSTGTHTYTGPWMVNCWQFLTGSIVLGSAIVTYIKAIFWSLPINKLCCWILLEPIWNPLLRNALQKEIISLCCWVSNAAAMYDCLHTIFDVCDPSEVSTQSGVSLTPQRFQESVYHTRFYYCTSLAWLCHKIWLVCSQQWSQPRNRLLHCICVIVAPWNFAVEPVWDARSPMFLVCIFSWMCGGKPQELQPSPGLFDSDLAWWN